MYDDVGNTDFHVTKFDIQVQAVLNAAYLAELVPDVVATAGNEGFTGSAADIMNMIRKRLLVPRRVLSFQFNGIELIPRITGLRGYVDAQNGPKPQFCSITPVTNETFLLQYHIIAHYWECPSIDPDEDPLVANRASGPVLFNRWTERVEIDDKNYSKRTREGKFMIRSDNPQGLTVDRLRAEMVSVGVPQGFLRESSEYAVTPDGLALEYRVVDQEVFILPPAPAFKAEGEYIETSTRFDAKRHGEVRVHLVGDKKADKAKLLEKAVQIGASKLYTRNFANNTFLGVLEYATFKIELYENDVEIRFRALLNPDSDNSGRGRIQELWGFRLDKIAETPLSTAGTIAPAYTLRGNVPLLLQAAAYYDPCLQQRLNCSTGQFNFGLAPGTAGAIRENPGASSAASPIAPDNPQICTQLAPGAGMATLTAISPDDFQARYLRLSTFDRSIWTDYVVQNRYEGDGHRYMLPVARAAGTTGTGPAAFVTLAAPTLLWIADWTATRTLNKPLIPRATLPDSNWVLMDQHLEPDMVTVGPDGVTPIYRISGAYVYGHREPESDISANVAFGRPPWLTDDYTRTLSTADLTDGLLLPQTAELTRRTGPLG